MTDLFRAIEANAGRQVSVLEWLVNIDSGTDNKVGLDLMADTLTTMLVELGLTVERVNQCVAGDHLIGRKRGRSGCSILLVGHMDTVFPAGSALDRPFRIEGDRAYGPGVLDMKGGLTVILFALRALRECAPETWESIGLRVILNSDQETGSETSRKLIVHEAAQVQAACVFEPARPGGEYVSARKGSGLFQVTVVGKAAHAGTQPQLGANALVELGAKILALSGLTNYSTGLTVNVASVRGGARFNIVPDFAEAEVDIRVVSCHMASQVEAKIQEIASSVFVPGTHTTITGSFTNDPMEYSLASGRLFGLLDLAATEVGFRVRHIPSGGTSNANTTSSQTPTIDGLGPTGDFPHTTEEFVDLASLTERTKVFARFLQYWLDEEMKRPHGRIPNRLHL